MIDIKNTSVEARDDVRIQADDQIMPSRPPLCNGLAIVPLP